MSISRSCTKTFEIEGFNFYHHYAKDSHGSVSNTYMVDGHNVSPQEFYRIIREATQVSLKYIATANGMYKV